MTLQRPLNTYNNVKQLNNALICFGLETSLQGQFAKKIFEAFIDIESRTTSISLPNKNWGKLNLRTDTLSANYISTFLSETLSKYIS